MFVKTLSLLMLVGVAFARDLTGVDPNTLHCDPLGQIHLLLPSFTDCNKFFTCDNGKEVEQSCPATLIFDFELQTCNWPWAVGCYLRTPPEEEEDIIIEGSGEGSGDGSGELDWAHETRDSRFDFNPVAKVLLAMNEARAQKVVDFSGVLDCSSPHAAARQAPYSGDCQRYWRCVDGLAHTFYCSDGLFFNEKSMQCDFEANVRCVVNHDEELNGEFLMYK